MLLLLLLYSYRRQHIHCTIFHKSIVEPASLDGYLELSHDDKHLVDERVRQSMFEVDPDRIAINPGNHMILHSILCLCR